MTGRRNQRSAEAAEYRKLYSTDRWQRTRAAVLLRDLYRCQAPGCGRALIGKRGERNAPVVNHRQAHKGDLGLFFDMDNLQALCAECHDGPTQASERRGYQVGVSADGRPIDAGHPWNRD